MSEQNEHPDSGGIVDFEFQDTVVYLNGLMDKRNSRLIKAYLRRWETWEMRWKNQPSVPSTRESILPPAKKGFAVIDWDARTVWTRYGPEIVIAPLPDPWDIPPPPPLPAGVVDVGVLAIDGLYLVGPSNTVKPGKTTMIGGVEYTYVNVKMPVGRAKYWARENRLGMFQR